MRLFGLKDHIDHNFCEIATAEELTRFAAMSETKATVGFKSLFGISIAKYLRQCKMAHAHARIISGESNVSEAAFEVGYTNISHFIRMFREVYGVTPKKIRQSRSVGASKIHEV
jgi:AraC-like DNA-binding protein